MWWTKDDNSLTKEAAFRQLTMDGFRQMGRATKRCEHTIDFTPKVSFCTQDCLWSQLGGNIIDIYTNMGWKYIHSNIGAFGGI